MITLVKQFSREKSLVYFCMWDRSDRAGYLRFAGHRVAHNLFLMPAADEKVSVYYSNEELAELFREIEAHFADKPEHWSEMADHLERAWKHISVYLGKSLVIDSPETFLEFFDHLTDWWTAMTVAFFIPDVQGIDASVREAALGYRERGEKYTEIVHHAMEVFWRTHLPADVLDLAFVVTPEELVALIREDISSQDIEFIRERLRGYGLFDGVVYPVERLRRVLLESGIGLDEGEVAERVESVRGTTAQPGRVSGPARIVIKKADLARVQPGDVIVAEMTNPDYVPWMKQAAAFVTDEGGMTCHAGIVARELGTPCVVGTKIATKVFKDGEMLEVDATNGIVKRM